MPFQAPTTIAKALESIHVFPKSLFKRRPLAAAGLAPERVESFMAQVNLLPNLQLLEGPFNVQKSAKLPHDWIKGQFPDEVARNAYAAKHDLGTIPTDLVSFGAFFDSSGSARGTTSEALERAHSGVGRLRLTGRS